MADLYAEHGHCPVFNCGTPLPSKFAVVCAKHYFCVPAEKVRAAMRMKIRAEREQDRDRRAKYASQVIIQTGVIVREIQSVRIPR